MYSPFNEVLPAAATAAPDNYFEQPEQMLLNSPFNNEHAGNGSYETFYENEDLYESEDALQLMEEEQPDLYGNEAFSWENTYENQDVAFETEINYTKAREWNQRSAQELRWNFFDLEVYKLLGFQFTSPSDDQLTDAVADYQVRNNLLPADGMIGRATWSTMLKDIIRTTSFSSTVIQSAIVANAKLKKILGWEQFETAVFTVLGFEKESPSDELFAKAIALWQPKWGFTGKMVDGRLGEKTWAAIRTLVLAEVEREKQASLPTEKAVNYPVIIKGTPGIYLHSKPIPSAKQTDKMYPTGEMVMVIALSTIATEKDWRKIQTKDKRTGWIQYYHLAEIALADIMSGVVKQPPGPYLVKQGDTLDKLVTAFYPDYNIQIGDDRRTIIHAFSILNQGKNNVIYKGTTDSWWRDHVLDRDMAETRRIYQTIQLVAGKLIYFPTESYIKALQDKNLVGVRPDWKNTAITIGKSIQGFLEGLAEGFIDAGIDTIKGLWDFIKDLFTGELFKQIYDLVQDFAKVGLGGALEKVWTLIKEIVGEKVDQIRKDFNHPNPYYKFHSIGKMIGYVLFEVVVAILTAGTSLAAKFVSKLPKIMELLKASTALRRVYNAVNPKRLKQAVAAFNHAEDLYNYVSLGTAVFKTMDAITNIGIEGISLEPGKTNETYYEAAGDYESDIMFEQEDDISKVWDEDAENIVRRILEKGDAGLAAEGIGQMDHVIRGQHNLSQNGIDLFGFSVHGGKVKVYIIEVKGGKYPALKNTKISGRQMGELWIENALDAAWDNKEVRDKMIEVLKFYFPGRTFTKNDRSAMKEIMMKRAQRVMVVSKNAVPAALETLRRLVKREFVKKLTLIEREVELEEGEQFEDETPKKPVLIRRLSGGKAYMVFDVATNVKATTANQKNATNSKIPLADIRTALAKWVDLNAVEKMLLEHNKLSPGNTYTLTGASTVDAAFTEAVHQFQVANYLDAAEQDGVLGPSTMDTLGFITHGLRSKISSSGLYGQSQLNRSDVKSQIPVLTNNEFTAANWFEFIMKPAWMGVKISQGVHVLLWRKLREAEDWLLKQTAYKGMTPAQLGTALGFTAKTGYSGARLSAAKEAMHGFGLALDINSWGNPWIGAGWIDASVGNTERTRMIQALRNAAGNPSLPGSTVFAYLNSIAQTSGNDTRVAHSTLQQRSNEFVAYLRTHAAERAFWNASFCFGSRDPLNGFLNLHTDLVYALRQIAGLAWGAIDFGPYASGDIMHFDMRTIGVGKFICGKIGGFVPTSGHPTIPPPQPTTTPEVNEEEYYNEADFTLENEPHEAIGEAGWNDEAVENLFEAENEYDDEYDSMENFSDEAVEQLDEEEALQENFEEENLFEGQVAPVTVNTVRDRIREYYNLAESEYTLDDGTKVKVHSQFRYGYKGQPLPPEKAKAEVKKLLRQAFSQTYVQSLAYTIHMAAYGRATPAQVATITQALINAGHLSTLATLPATTGFTPVQLIRFLQAVVGIGIDCAGYVQLAFIYAFTGVNGDPASVRKQLGLHARRGSERLYNLPSSHFTKVDILNARTGDLLVLKPKAGSPDNSIHTVIIENHFVNGDDHSFIVHASWGTDLYGEEAGGIGVRTFFYNASTGMWSDKHPLSGTKVYENSIGPYNKHPIKGVYRSKIKVESEKEFAEEYEVEFHAHDLEDYNEYTESETSRAAIQNRYYSASLGWNKFYDRINELLLPLSGQSNVSLGEEDFVAAVAVWQQQQGLSPADGIIGPKTWARMQPLLPPGPAQPGVPLTATPPPVTQILNFNQWHATKILDSINAGYVSVNTRVTYNPKTQLEQLALGNRVLNVNPATAIVQILPIIYHICEQAKLNNYRDIVIGSFIRAASGSSCTGHCAGRCIDINFTGGSFTNSGAVQMVINILNYLLTIPAQYRKSFGFGLPLQGSFFGGKSLPKFKSTSPSNLNDPTLRTLVPQLGIVFPDNDNHLHIQVKWI